MVVPSELVDRPAPALLLEHAAVSPDAGAALRKDAELKRARGVTDDRIELAQKGRTLSDLGGF